jgi:hypothetical protein
MSRTLRSISVFGIVAAALAGSQFVLRAQLNEPKPILQPALPGTRFSFEVIESSDAKYEGDKPGHVGRGGYLDTVRPNVALGDAVYRDHEQIGTITTVAWSRVQGSLTVEFDPRPGTRVAVGDVVWIDLNPQPAGTKKVE